MKHFPIFVDLNNQPVVVTGGGEAALAKLRLLLKTNADLEVYTANPEPAVERLALNGQIKLHRRTLQPADIANATLLYAADADASEALRVAGLAKAAGVMFNVVDNLEASAFITPAIVDRDPVTVAIGTEGAAPVLARAIKAKLEEELPERLGFLARIGKLFRPQVAALPEGRAQRAFWSDYYFKSGPRLASQPETEVQAALASLLKAHSAQTPLEGHVAFVGAGPGDPELLTLKARKALHEADVVIYDRLVSAPVLELCRREAVMVSVGKEGFGPSTPQDEINASIVEHAQNGAQVVRLKGGDPTIFGRLDEEIEALEPYGISYSILPGVTAASASVAAIGQSLTKRGRNNAVRFLTAHAMQGFAEQDWAALARQGEVSAVYMGKKAARFVQGRLLMHGAAPATPVTIIENASRPDQRIMSTTLAHLSADIDAAAPQGAALILLGLAPREAAVNTLKEAVI
ncbi:siroheme synthase CysG [Lentibacter algarum]|uniref:siroheme synthase CysG n=1 Tax=Lentibacter algarum TaxID=576131 RepID=UPI001C0651C5|nr:siroheme synthase CysG [Lentibacter algarum]MBU2981716.1 siroheme synthase CysG [Lentibacter algarum]